MPNFIILMRSLDTNTPPTQVNRIEPRRARRQKAKAQGKKEPLVLN